MQNELPVFSDIKKAHKKIKKYIHYTPVLTSESINKILGATLFLKCENFQKVGAFKFRGASNAIFSLTEVEARRGVGTHSSGNHAAAVSLAAKMLGIKAHIVMPRTAPDIKKKAVAGYGAEITFCEPTMHSRETTMNKIIEEKGIILIHSYNNFQIISGQGTAALELLEEKNDLDIVMTPVGGGGLLSGTSISVKAINKNIQIIAGEPKNADDAYRSFKTGVLVPSVKPNTIADGLLTSLGELTFAIIRKNVDDIITVSEQGIVEAMRMVWERMKIIIEPSSAVPIAAILENKKRFASKKIGVIISGGNVDLGNLPFK